jgi:hypothetical protein
MNDALQVFMAPFRKHAQARFPVIVHTGDELAHHRAVEQRPVFQVPMPPAGIFRIWTVFENVVG